MTQITDLNVGDIVRVSYFGGFDVDNVYQVVTVFKELNQATIYDGTTTEILDNDDIFEIDTSAKVVRTAHYQSNTDDGIDLIDFWHMQMSAEEFQGAMKSHMEKYVVRLGRKDDKISDLKKIEDFARRYRQKLEQEQ